MVRKALGAALLVAASCSGAAQAAWITSWATAPLAPQAASGVTAASPSFDNRTIRQILRLSAGGSALRVRFTNAYGQAALTVGGAQIGGAHV